MSGKNSDLKEFLLKEYGLLPEFIDGLTSLIEESEDYTCLTLKMMMGRDKGSNSIAFASPPAAAAIREGDGGSCSESKEVV
jgi:hypothetical protein